VTEKRERAREREKRARERRESEREREERVSLFFNKNEHIQCTVISIVHAKYTRLHKKRKKKLSAWFEGFFIYLFSLP
jgi:hypothetical protein